MAAKKKNPPAGRESWIKQRRKIAGIVAPKSVKILNLTYRVKFADQTERDAAEAFGWCDPVNQTIVVCGGISEEAMADTFLHECIHAMASAMDINWRKEEQVARRIATGICTLWKQNPAAFDWWNSLNKEYPNARKTRKRTTRT